MDGKKFEALIKESCEIQGLSYTRLKDAGWQGEDTVRRFTSKNLCDCIIFDGKTLLFAEAKHRKKSVEFKGLTQLESLLKERHKTLIDNISYGFIFCIDGKFFYAHANKIKHMQETLGKKSFNASDAEKELLNVETFLPKRARVERLDIRSLMEMI